MSEQTTQQPANPTPASTTPAATAPAAQTSTQATTSPTSLENSQPSTTVLSAAAPTSSQEPAKKDETPAAPVWEPYEIEASEDSPLGQEELDKIAGIASKYKLTKDEAQDLVKDYESKHKAGYSKYEESYNAKIKTQEEEIKKDPLFAPDKKDATFASISRAVQKFDDDKGTLAALLKTPEYGNNVVIARLLHKIGEQIKPDEFVGKGGAAAPQASPEVESLKGMYPEFFKG